jgi:cGMP-dependent protein kinase 2
VCCAAAESIGVIAEPEVVSEMISGDKTPYLVLASDGIFEFMQNQTVVNLVGIPSAPPPWQNAYCMVQCLQ